MKKVLAFATPFLFLLWIVNGTQAGPPEFSLDRDLPNYFKEGDKRRITEAMASALASILARMDVPYAEHGEIQTKGFFEKASNLGRTQGSSVLLTGRPLQNLLGYLYYKVFKEK